MKANFHTHSVFCDGNDAPDLDCAYEQAVELTKSAGFTHQLCFDGETFVPAPF